MTVPVDFSCRAAVSDRMWKAVEAYANKFDQVEVEEDEDDGEEDAAEEEDRAAADGEGASGGPQA